MQNLEQHGVNLHFGLGNTTVTITNATGVYQAYDYTRTSEKRIDKDQRNNAVTVTYSNPTDTGTVTYLASDSVTPATGNATMTYPDVQSYASITCDSPMSGSNWMVDDVKFSATQDTNTRITVTVWRSANVTT